MGKLEVEHKTSTIQNVQKFVKRKVVVKNVKVQANHFLKNRLIILSN